MSQILNGNCPLNVHYYHFVSFISYLQLTFNWAFCLLFVKSRMKNGLEAYLYENVQANSSVYGCEARFLLEIQESP